MRGVGDGGGGGAGMAAGWRVLPVVGPAPLLAALFCLLAAPNRFGIAFAGAGGSAFVGTLFAAAALTCACARRLPTALLRVGGPVAALLGALALAVPCSAGMAPGPAVSCAPGVLLGFGSAALLLAWGEAYARMPEMRSVATAFAAFALAAVLGIPLAAVGAASPALWWYLAALWALAGAAVWLAGRSGAVRSAGPLSAAVGCTPDSVGTFVSKLPAGPAAGPTSSAPAAHRVPTVPPSVPVDPAPAAQSAPHADGARPAPFAALASSGLWEPLAGLALSFISLVVPWGAFLNEIECTVPALWTVMIGWSVCAFIVVPLARAGKLGRPSFDLVMRVSVPVLAALSVALWMVGDIPDLSPWLAVLKGVGSGVSCSSFFVLAWVSFTHAPGRPGGVRGVLGMGLACAFAAAALIMLVHAVFGQQVAGTVCPVLSLLFLVVACVGSAVHLSRLTSRGPIDGDVPLRDGIADGAPAGLGGDAKPTRALTAEEAAVALGREHGLSPREMEVLGYLVGGRTAEGIAEVMGISPHTVRAHVRKIHEKLQVSSRDQIAALVERRRRG